MSDGKKYLEFIKEKLNTRYDEIKQDIDYLKADIDRMNDYYWENYTEMDEYGYENYDNMLALQLSVETNDENIKMLGRLKKMMDSPFFGSLDFIYEDEDEAERFYIGISNFSERKGQIPLIYDWRAPVSSLYYDYDKGKAQYEAPAGILTGEICKKVQYKIKNGKMIYEIENDFNIDDEILREELSKNGDVKLKNIIRTIQKEQNSIIRNRTDKYLIIQGCAGSGKTSIALHRIAYLLYHDRDRLKSSNVLILSPNGVFSDYIAHILPELGEERIREMTLDVFAYFELSDYIDDCEDRYQFLERMIELEKNGMKSDDMSLYEKTNDLYYYKQSEDYINELEGFVLEMEDWLIDFKDIKFRKFIMTADEIQELFYEKFADTPIFTRIEYICERFIDEYKTLGNKLEDEDEKEIREKFGELLSTEDIYNLYNIFLEEYGYETLPDVEKDKRFIGYEDLYPMLYLKYRLIKANDHRNVRHLVIDEMQDYTYLQYSILLDLFKCPKTILGDKAQTMEEENRDVLKFLPKMLGNGTRTLKLEKSYRNTSQIAKYADAIFHEDGIEYFEREGREVDEIRLQNKDDLVKDVISRLNLEDENRDTEGYETAAVLTLTMQEAREICEKFKLNNIECSVIDENSTSFKKGLTVAPFYYAKGLEFDQVFVKEADEKLNIYKKYQYICATRALHELTVYK